jgi:hypothetical protein
MAFEELIAGRPADVQDTARRVLAIARELVPDTVESHDGEDYGVGFGPGYKGLVFVITPLADRVRLGIAAARASTTRQVSCRAAGRCTATCA